MGEQTKYLVEVRCQPLPRGQEVQTARELTRELRVSFPVKQCRVNPSGLTIELVSAHPLAYGALKDLADLIEQRLSQRGAQLQSGVINQTFPGPVGAAVNSVINALENQSAARPSLIGLLRQFAVKIPGPPRPVPVMYFHWGLSIDLMLAGKLRQTPPLELTTKLN